VTGAGRITFGVVAALAVTGAVVAGLFALGSPREQRARRLDERRLDHLREIAATVDLHWTRDGRLISSLEEVHSELQLSGDRDPESGEPYAYEPLGEDRYRLCATFSRATPAESAATRGDFWRHGAGRHCFELEAKKIER
jgi:predicted acylesterase/phospholipase RssA